MNRLTGQQILKILCPGSASEGNFNRFSDRANPADCGFIFLSGPE